MDKDNTYRLLVSSCLLGQKVRYDAKDNFQNNPRLQAWVKKGPAEIQPATSAEDVLKGKAQILTIHQEDVTPEYVNGAKQALALAQQYNPKILS